MIVAPLLIMKRQRFKEFVHALGVRLGQIGQLKGYNRLLSLLMVLRLLQFRARGLFIGTSRLLFPFLLLLDGDI